MGMSDEMVKPTKEFAEQMGQRLRELRLHYGFTQQQVADYLEIDQSNYSKIENGKRTIRTVHQLEALSELYDCTHDYLMLMNDDYTPQEWVGVGNGLDIGVIAQVNQTMRYLKMLRKVEEVAELRRLNTVYIETMEKLKREYVENG